MVIAVYEYCCCQPQSTAPLAEVLRAEGWAMLRAIMEDLAQIAGAEAICLVADDFPAVPFSSRAVVAGDEEVALREAAASSDWVLVIAPETEGMLEERCRWVVEAGGRLLGPNLEAIRLTADKLSFANYLDGRAVRTPPTMLARDLLGGASRLSFPLVCKLRDGAGSQGMQVVADRAELESVVGSSSQEMIAQPYLKGTAASVAFLIGARQRLPLVPTYQHLSGDGRFSYLGGSAPLPDSLGNRAIRIAAAAIEVVPGLLGWVGVDVLLGPAEDGSEDYVIEINPRLTTSYVGLRRLAANNLAAAMLEIGSGAHGVAVHWRCGGVRWTAEGSVVDGPVL